MISKLRKFFGSKPEKPVRNISRNDPCWCGSGEKYKRCHLERDLERERRKAEACRGYS